MLAAPDPVLLVDGRAVRRNLDLVRARLGERRLFAVVKDNAYGHGMLPVARTLAAAGVGVLAVGAPAEAFALRGSGIGVEILSLRLFAPADAPRLVAADVVQAVFTAEQVDLLACAARAHGRRARVHVKVDVGLRRFGIPVEEAAPFVVALRDHPDVSLEGVLGTLSEDLDLDRGRIAAFRELRERAGRVPGETWHLASSHALLHDPGALLDGARVGCLLCGFPPAAERVPGLVPTARLEARVLGVRRLAPGERAGYGGRWRVEAPTTAVFVAAGLRHGLRSSLAAGGEVLVGGRRLPVRLVATDHLVAAAAPDLTAGRGDEAVLLGTQGEETIDLATFAARSGESPYTALAALRSRVRRALLGEGPGPRGYASGGSPSSRSYSPSRQISSR